MSVIVTMRSAVHCWMFDRTSMADMPGLSRLANREVDLQSSIYALWIAEEFILSTSVQSYHRKVVSS